MKTFDCIVIGAGAAGLMCAMRAGQRAKSVLLIEHTNTIGAKILISGGGRCNFTNRDTAPDRFLSENPHFCISALKSYTQHDFIALVEKHKIAYHEKTLGQMFCDGTAKSIVTMLVEECRAAGVKIGLNQSVLNITKNEMFAVETREGQVQASTLILATGGLSIPKMGATNFAHRVAEQFGVPLTAIRPALVPLTFSGEELAFFRALSGISLEVVTQVDKRAFREGMVMTHRGLSGPAILQISSYWREGDPLKLDILPDVNVENVLVERKKNHPKLELKTVLGELLPHRLAQALSTTYFTNDILGGFTDKKLKEFASTLKNWSMTPTGTEGYAKAEVTRGGIDTSALSSKTMMVEKVPGLYFIGEAVDVTGWLGGYNFQWAWSSGWAAGSAV